MNENGIKGSYLGKNTRIEGCLFFSGDLRIDGQVSGKLSGGEESRVFVSEKASVSGEIEAERVEVRGTVEAAINTQGLFVYAPGTVKGSVQTASLFVEEGAKFFNNID